MTSIVVREFGADPRASVAVFADVEAVPTIGHTIEIAPGDTRYVAGVHHVLCDGDNVVVLTVSIPTPPAPVKP